MTQAWYEEHARQFGGYRQLWDSHVVGESGEVAFTRWLRATLPQVPRVLDVGCGDGLYTLHMSALVEQITGLDNSPEMIRLAQRNQQAAAIENATFAVASTSARDGDGRLPFGDGTLDLIYSRRGPSSHLADARRVLRPGGLAAGIHTGAREVILGRLRKSGFDVVRDEEFRAVEVLPTLGDLALYLSRVPGSPDYTQPERQAELQARAAELATPRGYEIERWWFIWVGTARG